MENVKVKVIECDEKGSGGKKDPVSYDVFSKTALMSFFGRIMPKLMFTPMTKINSSLEATVLYMDQATFFVKRMIDAATQNKTTACPFHFDMVLAMGEAIKVAEEEEDDFDDDDDDAKNPNDD